MNQTRNARARHTAETTCVCLAAAEAVGGGVVTEPKQHQGVVVDETPNSCTEIRAHSREGGGEGIDSDNVRLKWTQVAFAVLVNGTQARQPAHVCVKIYNQSAPKQDLPGVTSVFFQCQRALQHSLLPLLSGNLPC